MNIQARRLQKSDIAQLMKQIRSKESPSQRRAFRQALKAKPANEMLKRAAGDIVLNELNNNPRSAACRRVSKFITLFNEALDLQAAFRMFFDSRDSMQEFLFHSRAVTFERTNAYGTGHRIKFPQVPEIESHNNKLNNVLDELYKCTKQYSWHPMVRHPGYGMPSFEIVQNWKVTAKAARWENRAMSWLCAKNGEGLDRFRRCTTCSLWFFALTEHQRYCSDLCRKRNASTSDAFKQKRKQYMRKYRQQEKEREQRANELVKSNHKKRHQKG